MHETRATAATAMLTGDEDTLDGLASAATLASCKSAVVRAPNTLERGAMRALRALGDTRGMRVDLGRTIGEGGMGLVREGTQTALGRGIAVKTVRPAILDEWMTLRLLQEAWITGALEHPNIIPIYDVGVDDQGAPVIVMRRIDGVAWAELIRDPAHVAERFGAEDLLEWNLQVLMTVCNAVAFAHSRGILHRDLKPDNVMIGDYGQVFVADWGIAVSLRDDGTGRLPLASEQSSMAGTPWYMAPEMLAGDGAGLSERSDIYLLGAILYEIIAGKAPHASPNRRESSRLVLASNPTFPDSAPPELREICRRAMAFLPEERFESAEELRRELALFSKRRGSSRLAEDAEVHLEALGEIATGAAAERRGEIHDLFGACRFGFQEALRAWDGNERARRGLRQAIERMVDIELAQNEPGAAAARLAEHDAPPPEYQARVEAALESRARRQEHVRELERFGRDHDKSIAKHARTALTGSLGLGVTATPLVQHLLDGGPSDGRYPHLVAGLGLLVALVAAIAFVARERLMQTAINRNALGVVGMTLLAQLGLFGGAWATSVPFASALVMSFVVMFACAAAGALAIETRFAPTALAFAAGFVVAAASPELGLLVMSAAGACGTANILWLRRDVFARS